MGVHNVRGGKQVKFYSCNRQKGEGAEILLAMLKCILERGGGGVPCEYEKFGLVMFLFRCSPSLSLPAINDQSRHA